MKIWILDENNLHVATISGDEAPVMNYANTIYPHGPMDKYRVDTIGPRCANAAFDNNPNAEIVEAIKEPTP